MQSSVIFYFMNFFTHKVLLNMLVILTVAWQIVSFIQTLSYSKSRFPINMLCQLSVKTATVLVTIVLVITRWLRTLFIRFLKRRIYLLIADSQMICFNNKNFFSERKTFSRFTDTPHGHRKHQIDRLVACFFLLFLPPKVD